jgi:hypothetical protein
VYAASPKRGRRMRRISSEPYADDEMQSLESTPRARVLLSRSSWSWVVVSGGPRTAHLRR